MRFLSSFVVDELECRLSITQKESEGKRLYEMASVKVLCNPVKIVCDIGFFEHFLIMMLGKKLLMP